MKKAVIGILAHVDAGKTTLAEAMLFRAGALRSAGRVDRGDTVMDAHELERRRGITIFAGQAVLETGGASVTLLDTPGHVDFSAEAERVLRVLDCAVLVISGTDGVQSHTRTLWRLLERSGVPVILFISKMDLARLSREELMAQLRKELSEGCVDFGGDADERAEQLAVCDDALLERFLEGEAPTDADAARLLRERKVFPCLFGSGLRMEGVDELLDTVARFAARGTDEYPAEFGARVFKISRDRTGARLTHMKITGGALRIRDLLATDGGEAGEKVSAIRIYSGDRFVTADEVPAGGVCTVTGLERSFSGQGLGFEASDAAPAPVLEPVMSYRIGLPAGTDPQTMMPKLRQLEEEDPQLHIGWNGFLKEITVRLMGEVQVEVLRSLIAERFGVEVTIDSGRVLYRETIAGTFEGVGHYEPLRHYAEVHLLLEPLPAGSGVQFGTKCSEDELDRNWQRLILTHLGEKQHLGVLTGSPLTDVRLTLMAGRAHLKHTEGGDFRQSTYRAVRQGLMKAREAGQCTLLEPVYAYTLTVPSERIGRAVSDMRMRKATVEMEDAGGGMSLLRGRVPVSTMAGCAAEVAAYSGGRGALMCEAAGYEPCHNAEEVIAAAGYDPEADLENSPDSVFCSHGAGFVVKWNEVGEYMHLPSCVKNRE